MAKIRGAEAERKKAWRPKNVTWSEERAGKRAKEAVIKKKCNKKKGRKEEKCFRQFCSKLEQAEEDGRQEDKKT